MDPPVLKLRTLFRSLCSQSPLMPLAPAVDDSLSMSPYGKLQRMWATGRAMALQAPVLMVREHKSTRTGGPDDDEDDELRRLMPILAAVITIAVVFGQ